MTRDVKQPLAGPKLTGIKSLPVSESTRDTIHWLSTNLRTNLFLKLFFNCLSVQAICTSMLAVTQHYISCKLSIWKPIPRADDAPSRQLQFKILDKLYLVKATLPKKKEKKYAGSTAQPLVWQCACDSFCCSSFCCYICSWLFLKLLWSVMIQLRCSLQVSLTLTLPSTTSSH